MDGQRKFVRNIYSGELNKFEEIITSHLWLIVLLIIISDAYTSSNSGQPVFNRTAFFTQVTLFIIIVAIIAVKKLIIDRRPLKPGLLFTVVKLAEMLLLSMLIITVQYGFIFYFIVFVPVISICASGGFSLSLPYLGFGLATNIAVYSIARQYGMDMGFSSITQSAPEYLIMNVTFFFILLVLFRIIGSCHNQFRQNEQDNQNLVDQLGKKYAQLEEARKEKQEQYDKLKEVNLQLEETNKKLTSSIAEFFTLQQISQAISSIFDMNELLQFVNDIIIGVMGVSTSNIALYSPGANRLKVLVSNISNKKDRAILTDNINTPYLKDAVDRGLSIINNAVNPDDYDFARGRNVRSLLCVPLQIKGKSHGLVLVEHSIPGAFDEDNVRLLEIITQQISIAIDNARLYEQLHELANTDGLTQVYNRVFFQNCLQNELDQALQQGYEVSVILYDIDDFKRFNDTYGHLFGDVVLKKLAHLVRDSIRKDDIVARFGGEEFIILLPHTGKDFACEKAEELRRKISELTIHDKDVTVSVTVSMGVSTFPTLANTELTLLNSADEALYEAKNSGKNCVRVANTSN